MRQFWNNYYRHTRTASTDIQTTDHLCLTVSKYIEKMAKSFSDFSFLVLKETECACVYVCVCGVCFDLFSNVFIKGARAKEERRGRERKEEEKD